MQNRGWKCPMCEVLFADKNILANHINTKHSIYQVKCHMCEDTFDENYKLEEHVIEMHKDSKKFECEVCGKNFVSNWRLEKHRASHLVGRQRSCHYYNNEKHCPYEAIGCKFPHVIADKCKF